MKKILQNRKSLIVITSVLLLACITGFLFYNHGRTTIEKWQSIQPGWTKTMVTDHLGSPSKKSLDQPEIKETYHSLLFATANDSTGKLKDGFSHLGTDVDALESVLYYQTNNHPIEMLTYKIGKSKKYIYFLNDEVIAIY